MKCGPKPLPLIERFNRRVTKSEGDGCWEWNGWLNANGYGVLARVGGPSKQMYAHRLSYTLHVGEIPDGMHVLHRCDNPKCVRVEHLFLGTQRDNNMDREAKGRSHYGERTGTHKLTQVQVDGVRLRLACGCPATVLARELGVHKATILHIKHGRTWNSRAQRITEALKGERKS